MGGVFSSRIPRASENAAREIAIASKSGARAFDAFYEKISPIDFGKTADSATRAFDSVHTTLDGINISSITFSAKIAGAFAAYVSTEGLIAQKRIARSLENIEEP